jgi:hypothetical protein
VEKYGGAGQAIDDNIILRMCFAYWIIKAAKADSKYVTCFALPW